MEGVQSRRKTDTTARDGNATLTPWKGENINDQNRTTRIRIVARLSPATAVEPNAFIWGQKPRAKALPTYLFFAERKQIALQSAKRNEYPDINYQFSKR